MDSFTQFIYLFILILFIYLFIFGCVGSSFLCKDFLQLRQAGATLHCSARASPLTIAASLVAEHRLQTRRLSNCGSWAHLLRGMWDPPGPGLEPVSPALAGRLSTTAPPGKPPVLRFFYTDFFHLTLVHICFSKDLILFIHLS